MDSQDTNCAPESVDFWGKLRNLTICTSTMGIYDRWKSSSGLWTGLVVIEKGVGMANFTAKFVCTRLATACPKAAKLLNTTACECLDMLEENVPALNKPAEEIMQGLKESTNTTLIRVFNSLPSRQMLYSINKEVDAPEKLLNVVAQGDKQCSVALTVNSAVMSRLESVEQENKDLRRITDNLRQMVKNLENRIASLESSMKSASAPVPAPNTKKPEPTKAAADDDYDDFVLFATDDEVKDAAAELLKEEQINADAAKKSNKPVLIAKYNIILDVKPWDDETDMKKLEETVRSITMDGLEWGASILVPVGYGIQKLRISCVVEDDKVSMDDLEEQIVTFEDYIQSMDIAAFNKV